MVLFYSSARVLAVALLSIWALATAEAAEYPPRVVFGPALTYANLAWGFSNGGKETLGAKSVVLVDLDEITAEKIEKYKAENRIVQCYFSVGTAEKWRGDYNEEAWLPLALGTLPQFQSEYWLDLVMIEDIKVLMQPRFNRAKELGCDAIEPDNTDCYDNSECNDPLLKKHPGSNVRQLQIDYCRWLADAAHKLGMAISLKNSAAIVPDLVDEYDFAVTEQCHQYKECNVYTAFTAQNKAVFNHEYSLGPRNNQFCKQANKLGIRTKRCNGKPKNGVCKKGSSWQNCFKAKKPLPLRTYTDGSTPTRSPVVTSSPTRKPTRRRNGL